MGINNSQNKKCESHPYFGKIQHMRHQTGELLNETFGKIPYDSPINKIKQNKNAESNKIDLQPAILRRQKSIKNRIIFNNPSRPALKMAENWQNPITVRNAKFINNPFFDPPDFENCDKNTENPINENSQNSTMGSSSKMVIIKETKQNYGHIANSKKCKQVILAELKTNKNYKNSFKNNIPYLVRECKSPEPIKKSIIISPVIKRMNMPNFGEKKRMIHIRQASFGKKSDQKFDIPLIKIIPASKIYSPRKAILTERAQNLLKNINANTSRENKDHLPILSK